MTFVVAAFICAATVFIIAASFVMFAVAVDTCEADTKELLKRVLRRKKGGEGDG